jgi:7,8-dihydropterin-6-yl-methyl-4-(beta-D-ribofuranosyl)aminobenzene 5'-phosphate synthase
MPLECRVTVVCENTVHRRSLIAEQGLALWVDHPQGAFLFDTGQGRALLPNARDLGLDLRSLRGVVLSHGHYDHGDGLAHAAAFSAEAGVHALPGAELPRYSRHAAEDVRAIGLGPAAVQCLAQRRARQGLPAGLGLSGPVADPLDWELEPGRFYLDAAATQPDPFTDEQALWIDTAKGLVVLVGCSHTGVVSMLRQLAAQTGRPLHAVLGGFHLRQASQSRLDKTAHALAGLGLGRIGAGHCTGLTGQSALRAVLGPLAVPLEVGQQWAFTL